MVDDDILQLQRDLGQALRAYRRDKQRYETVTADWRRRYPDDPVTADVKAASDPRLKEAIAYGDFHRSEITAYGVALCAALLLKADAQRSKP